MTQDVFPEINAATEALEKRISLTEAEIAEMNEAITAKKKLIKGWRKAVNAVRPATANKKDAA